MKLSDIQLGSKTPIRDEVVAKPAKVSKRGTNPNSLANLRPPWQKGETGNPAGPPTHGPKIRPALNKYLDMDEAQFSRINVHSQHLTVAEQIAVRTLKRAIQEDDKDGDKVREFVAGHVDGGQKPTGDTFNIEKAVLVRYIEGG